MCEPEDDSEDYAEVLVVPTSHASEASSKAIHRVVETEEPDVVALELDRSRLPRITGDAPQPDASLRDLLRQRNSLGLRGVALMALLGRAQSSIADKLGIDMTGMDMRAGYEAATNAGIPVALVDRDIRETLQRFSDAVSIRELLRMAGQFAAGYIHLRRTSAEDLEEQVQTENIDIDAVREELGRAFPTFKTVFIDERDAAIAEGTRAVAEEHGKTVLVIGAGHHTGVTERLTDADDIRVRTVSPADEAA